MCHVENGQVAAGLEFFDQLDDSSLRRHIETCGRFIEHDNRGVAGESHRDCDSLLLTSAQLVWVAPQIFASRWQLHGVEEFGNAAITNERGDKTFAQIRSTFRI